MLKSIKKLVLQKEYKQSKYNSEEFWKKQAQNISWYDTPTQINTSNFTTPKIEWFKDGKLNVTTNCVDIHAKNNPEKNAIIWENDNLTKTKKITYKQLQTEVNKLANVLKKHGIKKGDIVIIYMPLIPEAIYAMLACSKIGAVHSVVSAEISPDKLKQIIKDSRAKLIITANQSLKAGKTIPLKENVNKAITKNSTIQKILVVERTKSTFPKHQKDILYIEEIKKVAAICSPQIMSSTDTLFILYKSNSTNTPNGLVHSSGGYLTYAKTTFQKIFNYQKNDIFWSTADISEITGHTYLVYGPLSNNATILIHEGTAFYPNYSTHTDLIDKHKVNIYYTEQSIIRTLMKKEEEALQGSKRKTLKLLGSVGEPLNKSAYDWYYNKFGNKKCPITDTWGQTETGGIILTPQHYNFKKQPGFVGKPFFTILPVIKNEKGKTLNANQKGNLCIEQSWPGQVITIFGDHKKFKETYFSQVKYHYFSGDKAHYDKNGNFQIIGRVDDVINVSGHRLEITEIESDLNTNKNVL
jgi:acetyl-CoA synthetase